MKLRGSFDVFWFVLSKPDWGLGRRRVARQLYHLVPQVGDYSRYVTGVSQIHRTACYIVGRE